MSLRLLEPFTIKNMTLRNRIVMPPMCMYTADGAGMPNAFHLAHYVSRAVGGVGLIILEATAVQPRGRISDHCLGLWNDAQAEALAPIVRACQEQGAKVAIQLNHAGRKCQAQAEPLIHGPSALAFSDEYRTPREMTEQDMLETVLAFRAAAERAARIGFDAIEIHAAHGYLISEFLSPYTNKRVDQYGGCFDNRARFLDEIYAAVRKEVGADFPVTVRISVNEYLLGGRTEAESFVLARHCEELGFDAIHVSNGMYASPATRQIIAPMFSEHAFNMQGAQQIKELVHIRLS